ncbi:hypothetical protein KBTX_03085 [wastewater metagenome]|uniref:Uncharacterized protein n=2 Tax=unclassified sequences TaxID=12908 RepID=A0A5B8RGW5_9ZZZZ|nr:hypothetical protein KBTEX_03085 [uncultured organism]
MVGPWRGKSWSLRPIRQTASKGTLRMGTMAQKVTCPVR